MVTMRQILEVTDRIVEHFKPHKVILFGSRAYGRPTRDSDVDFLVIDEPSTLGAHFKCLPSIALASRLECNR